MMRLPDSRGVSEAVPLRSDDDPNDGPRFVAKPAMIDGFVRSFTFLGASPWRA